MKIEYTKWLIFVLLIIISLSFFIIFNLINDELDNFKENFYILSIINYLLIILMKVVKNFKRNN